MGKYSLILLLIYLLVCSCATSKNENIYVKRKTQSKAKIPIGMETTIEDDTPLEVETASADTSNIKNQSIADYNDPSKVKVEAKQGK